jgi:hypothetical protein
LFEIESEPRGGLQRQTQQRTQGGAVMAKGEQKNNREKKKPKADKNKKQKGQPFGGKIPMGQGAGKK